MKLGYALFFLTAWEFWLGLAGLSVQFFLYRATRTNKKFADEIKKQINGLGEKIVQLGEQVAYIEGRLDTERNPGARSSSVNDDANGDKEGA